MKYVIYLISFIIATVTSLHSQTVVSVQKEISKNMLECEFEFLDGSLFSKKIGEQWNIQKKGNQLKVVGNNPNSNVTEVTFLDGSSYYSTDNQKWHQKSYVVTNQSIEKIEESHLTARFDEQSFSIDIEYSTLNEGNGNFYLISMTGNSRILLGSSFVSPGINKIQFKLNEVNSGNYFVISDQNNISSICKITIF